MSVLHAQATWHTGEHNVEEEWRQINISQMLVSWLVNWPIFDSYFNTLTVNALRFFNPPPTSSALVYEK